MTTISGSLPSNSFPSPAASGAARPASVAPDPELARKAADIANDAGILVTFGGSPLPSLTYEATGLLRHLVHAGLLKPSGIPASAGGLGISEEGGADRTAADRSAASSLYTAKGALEVLPSQEMPGPAAAEAATGPSPAPVPVAAPVSSAASRTASVETAGALSAFA